MTLEGKALPTPQRHLCFTSDLGTRNRPAPMASPAPAEKGCGCAGEEAARAYAARKQASVGASCGGNGDGSSVVVGGSGSGVNGDVPLVSSEWGLAALAVLAAGSFFVGAWAAGGAVIRAETEDPTRAVPSHGAPLPGDA